MRTHHLLLPFLGVALIAAPALSQIGQTTPPSPQPSAVGWITQLQPDQWRTSDLEGLAVYSSNNADKIGNIDDLIFDSSGRVQAVVIGVGGYLGLGERDIAVPFGQIRFETSHVAPPQVQQRARPDWREPALEAAPSLHRQPERRQCQQTATVLPYPTHQLLAHQKRQDWDKRLLLGAAPPPIMPF